MVATSPLDAQPLVLLVELQVLEVLTHLGTPFRRPRGHASTARRPATSSASASATSPSRTAIVTTLATTVLRRISTSKRSRSASRRDVRGGDPALQRREKLPLATLPTRSPSRNTRSRGADALVHADTDEAADRAACRTRAMASRPMNSPCPWPRPGQPGAQRVDAPVHVTPCKGIPPRAAGCRARRDRRRDLGEAQQQTPDVHGVCGGAYDLDAVLSRCSPCERHDRQAAVEPGLADPEPFGRRLPGELSDDAKRPRGPGGR